MGRSMREGEGEGERGTGPWVEGDEDTRGGTRDGRRERWAGEAEDNGTAAETRVMDGEGRERRSVHREGKAGKYRESEDVREGKAREDGGGARRMVQGRIKREDGSGERRAKRKEKARGSVSGKEKRTGGSEDALAGLRGAERAEVWHDGWQRERKEVARRRTAP